MFDFLRFAKDNEIQYVDEGKNTSPDWVNLPCPFCNDSSNHLGFNLESGVFNCWRCGSHSILDVILAVTHCSEKEGKYKYVMYQKDKLHYRKEKRKIDNKEIKLPDNIQELNERARKYLMVKRNFDPDKLIDKYNLGYVDNIGEYKFRIIAPVFYNGKIVSYQGRDITEQQELRYKACSLDDEIIPHKHILYNLDHALADYVIVVEGITDVWRMGDNTVGTFGISYTQEQVLLLANRYKKVFIIFDNEEVAQEKARKLGESLTTLGVETEIIDLEIKDPATLNDEDAIDLKNILLEERRF